MKQVILFRHGKSERNTNVADFDRGLSSKGIKRTKRVAKKLAKFPNLKIDRWYSSPARRADRTAIIASDFFSPKPEIHLNHRLYGISCPELIKFIKGFNENIKSVIIFGHNEAFTDFVNQMGSYFIGNLPTSGVAILQFDVLRWKEIEKGKTLKVIRPKDL